MYYSQLVLQFYWQSIRLPTSNFLSDHISRLSLASCWKDDWIKLPHAPRIHLLAGMKGNRNFLQYSHDALVFPIFVFQSSIAIFIGWKRWEKFEGTIVSTFILIQDPDKNSEKQSKTFLSFHNNILLQSFYRFRH